MVLHCKWIMLLMTLDMLTRALAEDDISEERAIL
jgi:hypothetical protein